ncbi:hypothetical protein SAMN05216511_0077 [Streptomyces sp. KS_16]|nr:hypothetical protein BX261_7173 [Streptomyces sp. 2321.6]SDQ63558.1 hypothetical protein SAMN05216511_0077 [Streptomyces sp. KS_16]SEE17444.1 hypothetical protein SAMN05428940_7196 [Streptomyces sp. 2133.1]SNC74216.1 hypothetical protein SAMN06272741_7100 [Streptomyces sp. 2114.4]
MTLTLVALSQRLLGFSSMAAAVMQATVLPWPHAAGRPARCGRWPCAARTWHLPAGRGRPARGPGPAGGWGRGDCRPGVVGPRPGLQLVLGACLGQGQTLPMEHRRVVRVQGGREVGDDAESVLAAGLAPVAVDEFLGAGRRAGHKEPYSRTSRPGGRGRRRSRLQGALRGWRRRAARRGPECSSLWIRHLAWARGRPPRRGRDSGVQGAARPIAVAFCYLDSSGWRGRGCGGARFPCAADSGR